jgi:hypothetical protein
MPKLATGENVAVAFAKWALAAQGFPDVLVATTLPAVAVWGSTPTVTGTGAVQVEGIVGTTAHDTNLRDHMVSYGGWAARINSDKPPWGQANELLEVIREQCFAYDFVDWVELDLEPAGVYQAVAVQGAIPQVDPRRIPDPDASRAHYSMDLRLIWVAGT